MRFGAGHMITREQAGAQATAQCRERFAALQEARDTFGRQAFDALLYKVVAPTMQFSESTADPDPVATYLLAERGCQ